MPLLIGETLAELLDRRRRLEPPLVAQIGLDVARALTAAHGAGIIHRDLKPANIFLHREPGTEGVVVKVVDFGLSKRLEAKDTNITATGKVVGTPSYMSPEQLSPENGLDHRTDIWSLGVILFELLTGVRPFQGDKVQVVTSILSPSVDIPLVSQFVRFVPPRLTNVVSRCLVRDRNHRIGTAAQLVEMLQAFASPGNIVRVYSDRPDRAPSPSLVRRVLDRPVSSPAPGASGDSADYIDSHVCNGHHDAQVSESSTIPVVRARVAPRALRRPPAAPPVKQPVDSAASTQLTISSMRLVSARDSSPPSADSNATTAVALRPRAR
jgi:serine/threonine protein kinase